MLKKLEHGRPIRALAPIASEVDASAMRELLLVPAYAACGVLALVALVFAAVGALLAIAVIGPILLIHTALVQLGLRAPALPSGDTLWGPHDG